VNGDPFVIVTGDSVAVCAEFHVAVVTYQQQSTEVPAGEDSPAGSR
jgi:hypothetical protein